MAGGDIVRYIQEADFEREVLQSPGPVVVAFWAPWSDPSVLFAPVITRAARAHASRVKTLAVNVEETQALRGRYGIVAVALVRRMRAASGKVRRAACDACRTYAPVMNATYHQNTGMLMMRQHRQASGAFCRGCHFRVFWRFSLHTFFLGWWGTISFVLTPIFLLNNMGLFIASQTLPGGAKVAEDLLEQRR